LIDAITIKSGNHTGQLVMTKKPAEYLRLPSTLELISAIENRIQAMGKSHRLVDTTNGIGTWLHEDVSC
jgi:two-component sensor histidine kinase